MMRIAAILACNLATAAVSATGLAASSGEDWKGTWVFYTEFYNRKVETAHGLSKALCLRLREAELQEPGPRGPHGMPIRGYLDPTEIKSIECVPSDPVS